VCETTRFDVISALKCKGWLVFDAPEDDCEPRRHRSRCDIKQCFYITICYNETESEFETPFQSSCTAGPKQCMPTRTHEGVRFDVTKTLPPKHSYLDDLEKRIRECFHVNCHSPVGAVLKTYVPRLLSIMDTGSPFVGDKDDPCELFCTLRAYFLNHLKTNPDQFNCNLFDEVSCLSCPKRPGPNDPEHDEKFYLAELRESLGLLLFYIQRYQYDCVFGDLIFSCQQPCEAHCLVLGTVEVLNGKLVRVCNTPRNYLWAPANLLQVLIYDIMTGGLTAGEGCDDRKVPCCPDYRNFDPIYFLTEFGVDQCARREAATSSVHAFREAAQSLHHSFDFTDSMAISSAVFANAPANDREKEALTKLENLFGISIASGNLSTTPLNALTPMQALQSNALLRRNDAAVAYKAEGEKSRVLPDFLDGISPDRSVGGRIEKVVKEYQGQADQTARQLAELKAQVEILTRKIDGIDDPKKTKKSSQQKDES
jgi:hypothetical protein